MKAAFIFTDFYEITGMEGWGGGGVLTASPHFLPQPY